MRLLFPLLFLTMLTACGEPAVDAETGTDGLTEGIYLNQEGYYTDGVIRFSVLTYTALAADIAPAAAPATATTFQLISVADQSVVAEGELGEEQDWRKVGGVKARYTELAAPAPGTYRIEVPGYGYSHPFTVQEDVLRPAFIGSLKSNYYQRMSMELLPEYAGKWARPAGHPDLGVAYHPSSGKTSGTLDSPGGWYDAGDFNKYIVNASFPMGQYLALYEDIGDPMSDGVLNIPESGNGKSDYLDELKYELDWMLTMQDDDGGLFHKLTTLKFEGMVMPHEATSPRFVVGKSTEATLNFAAATAQAARIYYDYDPVFARRLLAAARRAWAWAVAHPEQGFTNPEDVSTGEYGDKDWYDERTFAAAELFATTGEQAFLNALQVEPPRINFTTGEGWRGFMGKMGVFTLLRYPDRVPKEMHDQLKAEVLALADSLVAVTDTSAFVQPINAFKWGSTSDVLNAGIVLAAAYQQEAKPEYLEAIRAGVDYIFGHNPTGHSYVTGFGDKTPMFIHHRQSAADGIAEPVPGLLSGGANASQQDTAWATYPENAAPMQSWVDQEPSYASNEICLNWNAPLTYILGWLEARN
ncbi:MAG: glycoside hydrolase family 9 protein [Bacteroidota bacterium]